jgi:hypothetical protein
LAGKPARQPRRELFKSVYRTGVAETQRDWSVLNPLADKTSEALAEVKPTEKEVLMKEYLIAVFVEGMVMEVTDSRGVSTGELLSGQSAGGPGQAESLLRERRLYQVVSRTLVSKKFVTTEGAARLRRMRCAVVLQRLALHSCVAGQSEPSVLAVVPEGSPEAQDVMTFGSYRDLRDDLVSWTVEGVTEEGGLLLGGRRPLGQYVWTVLGEMDLSR